jgi:hypothetical protein
MKLIYDTGSDQMLVEGRDCKDCLGNRYDPNTSSYYREVSPIIKGIQYGNIIHVRSKPVEDEVCLQAFQYCMTPTPF